MSHEPSVKRLLKSDRAHWIEMDGGFYVTDGFAIVRVDEAPLIAWIKASYTESTADAKRVIDGVATSKAEPTYTLVDPTGITCRVFRTPTGPLAVNTQLLTLVNGKATVGALNGLDWRTGDNGVSGWIGDVCIIAAMGMNWQNGDGTRSLLDGAAKPLEVPA